MKILKEPRLVEIEENRTYLEEQGGRCPVCELESVWFLGASAGNIEFNYKYSEISLKFQCQEPSCMAEWSSNYELNRIEEIKEKEYEFEAAAEITFPVRAKGKNPNEAAEKIRQNIFSNKIKIPDNFNFLAVNVGEETSKEVV